MSENNNQKENFIEAIKEDSSYEWNLTDSVWIHTDVEFDGTFLPSVHAYDPENYSKQEIDDIMVENEVTDAFAWDFLEWSENNQCWYPVVSECEYEEIDFEGW
jgi:hypothetical protein